MSGRRPQVGVVGLGPMGSALTRNFVARGFDVAVYNRTRARAEALAAEPGVGDHVTVALSLQDLAAALAPPRAVVVLVDTRATAAVLVDLEPWLAAGDVVLDAGNSAYADTIGRQSRLRSGVHLLDVGLASGVDGAREGISATVGGDLEAYRQVEDVLTAVSTAVDGRSCCVRVGEDGAGHFVKTVHNGVEYSMMQLVAELVDVLRAATGVAPQDLAVALARWDVEEFDSFVLQVAVDVLRCVDGATDVPFVDVVDDRAVQNGSGSRAARSALSMGAAAGVFAESSFARVVSSDAGLRRAVAPRPEPPPRAASVDPEVMLTAARSALRASLLVTYGQALRHLEVADRAHRWGMDLSAVVHSWSGATIRSAWLREVGIAVPRGELPLMLAHEAVAPPLGAAERSLRQVVTTAVSRGVAAPCLSSALAYLDGVHTRRSSGAVVQALRSRLGGSAHRRTDRPGTFRLDWETGIETRLDTVDE